MYLKRYDDIHISDSGVWRILKRLDVSRLPASQRYKRHKDRRKRHEKALPGHRIEIDVKFVTPMSGAERKKQRRPFGRPSASRDHIQSSHPQKLALKGQRRDPVGADIAGKNGKENLAVVLGGAAAQ
jgi:hypothetical protein